MYIYSSKQLVIIANVCLVSKVKKRTLLFRRG
nr:MAG TPA: hypothetical protein [Caudoviricetes sp.]